MFISDSVHTVAWKSTDLTTLQNATAPRDLVKNSAATCLKRFVLFAIIASIMSIIDIFDVGFLVLEERRKGCGVVLSSPESCLFSPESLSLSPSCDASSSDTKGTILEAALVMSSLIPPNQPIACQKCWQFRQFWPIASFHVCIVTFSS